MAVSNSGVKDRFFWVFDGATPQRHYVKFFQLDQPTLPLMAPRPTSTIALDGGRATDFMTTTIDDEAVPFQGIEITLRLRHLSRSLQLLDALGNPLERPNWVVGAHTWTGMAVSSMGTRKNSDGVNVACVPPKDVPQQGRMVSFVCAYNVPADAPDGTPLIYEAKGVVVTNVMDVPEGNSMFFDVTAMIYGEINPRLTEFPTGIESFPS